jgi:hypothetical protein
MMKKTTLFFLLLCSSASTRAQQSSYKGFPSLVWPKLYDISFTKGRDALGEYHKPVFSEAVKSLRNKSVVLPGYMVPMENAKSSSTIMLSSLPLNACFFCGVGGPETVVEVNLKTKTSWLEEPIEVKGILRLNDRDPDQMIYVLDDAEVLGLIDF